MSGGKVQPIPSFGFKNSRSQKFLNQESAGTTSALAAKEEHLQQWAHFEQKRFIYLDESMKNLRRDVRGMEKEVSRIQSRVEHTHRRKSKNHHLKIQNRSQEKSVGEKDQSSPTIGSGGQNSYFHKINNLIRGRAVRTGSFINYPNNSIMKNRQNEAPITNHKRAFTVLLKQPENAQPVKRISTIRSSLVPTIS